MKERGSSPNELEIKKWERRIGTFHYYSLIAMAVAGTGAAISSVPLTILNELPRWGELTMASAGSYFSIASTYSAKEVKPLLDQVRKEEKELRNRFKN